MTTALEILLRRLVVADVLRSPDPARALAELDALAAPDSLPPNCEPTIVTRLETREVTVAQGFDDHPTVVALEFLVKRLIVRDCLRGGAPDSALAELQDAMKVHRELLLRLAFGPDAGSDETTLNAVSAAAEFDRIGKEIAEDLRDAKG